LFKGSNVLIYRRILFLQDAFSKDPLFSSWFICCTACSFFTIAAFTPTSSYFCPMRIDIISVVPELLESPLNHSIMKRAQQKGLLEVQVHHLRQWAVNEYGQVDDYQYGGGAGMVMMCEPLAKLLDHLMAERTYDEIIYLTPDGVTLSQGIANSLSLKENLVLICGHYKGIDERIREHYVTREISIGDYVLSGGELAAAVLVDAIGRLLPGVLNDETSALFDSFQDGLLAPPVYTRPADFRGWKVPDILLSGDLKKVEEWRFEQALQRTRDRRPDLMEDEE
jgi:tRNA (guanine37-N1)-methyltransferase